MANKKASAILGGSLGMADILLGAGAGVLINKLTKKRLAQKYNDVDIEKALETNPNDYHRFDYKTEMPQKTAIGHNENINADFRDKYALGNWKKDQVAKEVMKNRSHLFTDKTKGESLEKPRDPKETDPIVHPYARALRDMGENVTPVLPKESYEKIWGGLDREQLDRFRGGYQDYTDETNRAILQSQLGMSPYEMAHVRDEHANNMKQYELRKAILGDAAGAPPQSFEEHVSDIFNEAHKKRYATESFTPEDFSMQNSPIYGNDFSLYNTPVADTKLMDKNAEEAAKLAFKAAAYGGEVPRYDSGGYGQRTPYGQFQVQQFAGGGVPGMQQAMTADMARAANVGGQYQQEIMRELMGEGQQSDHPVDYRTRMMMESFVGRDPANPTMGSSAQQAQQQQQAGGGGSMSQNGVSDPTGQLFQGQGGQEMDPLQMQQQQQMNDAMRSKIPYYQNAYQKALQHSQNPKGAMRNVMPPKMRM